MVRQAHHDICHPELVEGWKRGARGDFLINVNSIMRPLIHSAYLSFLQYCMGHPNIGLSDFSASEIKEFVDGGGNRELLDACNILVAL
jgi:hypothetical protein